MSRAWAEIDLDAIRHNVRVLRAIGHPAQFCAVVKANGYGHGAAAVGRPPRGGRRRLASPSRRGGLLRDAGIEARCALVRARLDEVDDAVHPARG